MSSSRAFKQDLSKVSQLWASANYDSALDKVEELKRAWPGNSHLHILWASLVQLQDVPKHSLAEARDTLLQAVEFDRSSPASAIELGHFFDGVEDNPRAAAKVYSDAVSLARRQLVDGLIGQAKALLQIEQVEEAYLCVLEIFHLLPFEPKTKASRSKELDLSIAAFLSRNSLIGIKSLPVEQIEHILAEVVASRSA